MLSRVFRQTRISIELIDMAGPFAVFLQKTDYRTRKIATLRLVPLRYFASAGGKPVGEAGGFCAKGRIWRLAALGRR
jgi:hypothetical protein